MFDIPHLRNVWKMMFFPVSSRGKVMLISRKANKPFIKLVGAMCFRSNKILTSFLRVRIYFVVIKRSSFFATQPILNDTKTTSCMFMHN